MRSQTQAAETEFTVQHFATNCATVKLVKLWRSSHFSELSDLSSDGSPCEHNIPGKSCEASPAGYIHGKAAQWSTKDYAEWLYPSPSLFLSWCGASRTIRRWKPWGISRTPRRLLPRSFPEEMLMWKWGVLLKNHYSVTPASLRGLPTIRKNDFLHFEIKVWKRYEKFPSKDFTSWKKANSVRGQFQHRSFLCKRDIFLLRSR